MIQLERALEIYRNSFPKRKITGAFDIGDAYLLQAEGLSGEPIYAPPIMVLKATGAIKVVFPPHDYEKLSKAVPLSISELL